ncbi:ATP-binding cassette domain-containing protein [Streptomyces echinatus]|uniref:ATP-binding cassette domain-containing protein n=1 Tax=Streptomyces echinatus TaxID=67293 RepID=UPI0037A42253
MGLAAQEINVDRFLSIRQILVYHAGYHGIGRKAAARRADELLALFRLDDKADVRAYELSGGMQRRLVLTRALMHRPRLGGLRTGDHGGGDGLVSSTGTPALPAYDESFRAERSPFLWFREREVQRGLPAVAPDSTVDSTGCRRGGSDGPALGACVDRPLPPNLSQRRLSDPHRMSTSQRGAPYHRLTIGESCPTTRRPGPLGRAAGRPASPRWCGGVDRGMRNLIPAVTALTAAVAVLAAPTTAGQGLHRPSQRPRLLPHRESRRPTPTEPRHPRPRRWAGPYPRSGPPP